MLVGVPLAGRREIQSIHLPIPAYGYYFKWLSVTLRIFRELE